MTTQELLLGIFAGTLVLEDATLAGALILVAKGDVGFAPAFASCALGILVGDLGLYLVGGLLAEFGGKS